VKVGLVGFGGSGKSTVFSALTGVTAAAGKGSLGQILVPDERIDRLAEIWTPKKTTYAEISFVDYAAGSFTSGSGAISASVLGEMRTLEVLAEVVDAFSGDGVAGAAKRVADFHAELLLSDLAIIEKRIDRLAREKGQQGEQELLEMCRAALENDEELSNLPLEGQQLAMIGGFRFLTIKPRLVVINVAEDDAGVDADSLRTELGAWSLEPVAMCAPLEYELTQLSGDERQEFLTDLGLEAGARERFITSCYRALELITFLTAGEDEVRAWPIRRGTVAVDAAGKIHSDIARGFIRAEIVAYDDFIEAGSEAACRQAGKLRTEGKEYVVCDGDIAHFRFNV
jgi:GTP-binding protein YchF